MIDYCKNVASVTAPLAAVTAVNHLVGGMSRHIGKVGAALLCVGAIAGSSYQFYRIANQKIAVLTQEEQNTGQSKQFQKVMTVALLAAGTGVCAVACICVAFPPPPKLSERCWEWHLTGSSKGMTGSCDGKEIFERVEKHPKLPPMVGYNYYALPNKVKGTGTAQVTSLAKDIFEQCSSLSYTQEKFCLKQLFEEYNTSNKNMRDLQAVLNTVRGGVMPGVDYHRSIMSALVLPQNLEVVEAVPSADSLSCTLGNVGKIARTIAELPEGTHVFRFFRPSLEYSPSGAVDTRSTLFFSDGPLSAYFDPGHGSLIAGRFASSREVAYQLAYRIVEKTAGSDGKKIQLRIYQVKPMSVVES